MKNNIFNKNWLVILISSLMVGVILWNTYIFFQNFKIEERNKMELWSLATLELIDIDGEISNLTLEVLKKNKTTPMIKIDTDGVVEINNIDDLKKSDSLKLKKLIKKFSSENEPIKIFLSGEHISTLYYGNSGLLNKLKFYPFALLFIAVLFGFVAFLLFKSSKIAEMNMLWSGMAKETAHQLGTPISSLMAWVELLKFKLDPDEEALVEIAKDVNRLEVVAERFSKIGSEPTLEKEDLMKVLVETTDYLRGRVSKNVLITIDCKLKEPVWASLNVPLFSWVIENLTRNAVDAMVAKGAITFEVTKKNEKIILDITDTGKGIAKSRFNTVFQPGFTTKKRGWGLGLSLVKRIVEDYHHGKVYVLRSDIGVGTTFRILIG